MSILMPLITLCACEKPQPNIRYEQSTCPICGKKERILFPISCGKCGHMIADEKINLEAERQELRHKHTYAEGKAWLDREMI